MSAASSSTAPADATVKIITVGDSGVGKSCMLIALTTGAFDPSTTPTIGSDFFLKRVKVVDKDTLQQREISLQLWDTAGQERFTCMSSTYYRNARAAVLVYDVNQPETFAHIEKWLGQIEAVDEVKRKGHRKNEEGGKEEAQEDDDDDERVYLLVGNKTDLCANDECMAVDRNRAQAFAQEHGMLFALTSAKTMRGIAEAFDEVARAVYDANKHNPDFFNTQQQRRGWGGGNENGGVRRGGCC